MRFEMVRFDRRTSRVTSRWGCQNGRYTRTSCLRLGAQPKTPTSPLDTEVK